MTEVAASKWLWVASLALVGACTPKNPAADSPRGEANLAEFEIEKIPDTVEHRLYADFEGKVQLLGYEISPDKLAPPGAPVSMKLYWQRTGSLGKGWGLFTHVLDDKGRQLAQFDDSGPLRESDGDQQIYGPSSWQLGKIYLDEVNFDVPRRVQRGEESRPLDARRVTVAVGVWKGARSEDPGGAARLDVIGHPADSHRRALVAHLATGVEPPDDEPSEPEEDSEGSKR